MQELSQMGRFWSQGMCVCVWSGFAFDLVCSYSIIPSSNITLISPLKLKGYSSKCDRCRHQQAVRYANQKTKDGVTVDVDGDLDPEAPESPQEMAGVPVISPMVTENVTV